MRRDARDGEGRSGEGRSSPDWRSESTPGRKERRVGRGGRDVRKPHGPHRGRCGP